MEIELSQQQQQRVQYYYNSSDVSCYSHYNYPCLELGEFEQESPVSVSTATTTIMKSDEGVPEPTSAYWSWEQLAPLDTDSLDLISNTATDFFDDVPQSSSAGDYMAQACAADDFSPSQPPPLPTHSAFTPYDGPSRRSAAASLVPSRNPSSKNAHARMLDYLRQLDAEAKEEGAAAAVAEDSGGSGSLGRSGGTSRCFRHMMRERQRRERLSQSYADLYSLVSGRSKADKNSIVQASAAYLKELSNRAERLKRRNQELRARDAAAAVAKRVTNRTSSSSDAALIRLRVGNPCSSVDSVIAALRRLKGMGVQALSIRANVSGQDLNAVIDVDTNMATAEVESALQGAIVEVEKKLQRGSGAISGGGGTVSLNGGAGSTITMAGPSSLVPDSYSFGGAGPFLPASAPSYQQPQRQQPRSVVGWPSSYNSTSGSHVSFRHIS